MYSPAKVTSKVDQRVTNATMQIESASSKTVDLEERIRFLSRAKLQSIFPLTPTSGRLGILVMSLRHLQYRRTMVQRGVGRKRVRTCNSALELV
jgi:hypothetical protein